MALAYSPYILQWAPFPKNCSFPWGSGPPSNTLFLGPNRVHNPTDRFSRFCTVHSVRRACRGRLFPLKSKCHLHMGDLYTHLIRGSLGPRPPDSASQPECRSVQPSLHSARQKVPLLYNERLFPQNLPLLIGYLDST